MLWNLGPGWMLLALVSVGILSFIIATALDALMGENGFGASGNAIILTIGFFLSILVANKLGYRLSDLERAVAVGVGGAFVCFVTMTITRGILQRR